MRHHFEEDDELELERIDRNMQELSGFRDEVVHRIKAKKMDPKDEKLVEVAWIAGKGEATEKALREKIEHLEQRIKARDLEIERTEDRDQWKARAEAAEATIERMKKRKRR